eukprot:TRINITY_DN3841_c0_g1_i1.p1 TRINITY_DN3841_c0_g1~~TRINITY_DN3841_c0_g1_i1.p1  ORF type:complete len:331 (-),score=63.39 TRINITY_DN3841_c0_g1_i1:134-1126(-)
MTEAAVVKAKSLFSKLKEQYDASSPSSPPATDAWKSTLAEIKSTVIKFPAFLPPALKREITARGAPGSVASPSTVGSAATSPEAAASETAQVALLRDSLELGVLLAARAFDLQEFDATAELLFFCYSNPAVASSSARRPMIVGLYFLFLLCRDRLADFHAILERLDPADKQSPYVRDIAALERHLTGGSYAKVLAFRSRALSNEYAPFLDRLVETVRLKAAEGLEAAYPAGLPVQTAASLLLLAPSPSGIGSPPRAAGASAGGLGPPGAGSGDVEACRAAVAEYGKERGWKVAEGRVTFPAAAKAASAVAAHRAALAEQLVLAAELERVV